MVKICYVNDCEVEEENVGQTLLDVSLKHGIPHTHACGGRARCSTCRVVVDNPDQLQPRTEAETLLADKKGFDATVRLACQAGLSGDVTVRRLVVDETDMALVDQESSGATGREANLAVLFSDVRNFTVFSESNLPYDVIHILNRYFGPVGDAILANNGYIDKYMGDGIMALFGIDRCDPVENCLDAVRAALAMREAITNVNAYLATFTDVQFRAGIGIHFGTAVVGEIGHPAKRQFTAIGDTVNMASRIESATKTYDTDLLVSECLLRQVADHLVLGRTVETELKGKSGTYALHEVITIGEAAVK
jgi:adenylate cyclase